MAAHQGGLYPFCLERNLFLSTCESRCLLLRLPHPQYRRKTGGATWTQATCQGLFTTGALSPGELGGALFARCSVASSRSSAVWCVSARAPAKVDAVALWSCTFTVDVRERRHFSEANMWQMNDPKPTLLAKCRSLQIHPLALRCLCFMRLTHLNFVGPSVSPFFWVFLGFFCGR